MSNTKIPEGWQKVTLGEFMEFKNGINADKSAYGQGTKFVNVMDIFRNSFLKKDDIAGKVQISDKQRSEYSVIHGDILFNRTSETREEIAYSTVYRGVISPAYTVLTPVREIVDDFYTYFFKSYIFIEKYLSLAVVGIREGKQINFDDFKTIKIPYPSPNHQVEIADTLNIARQEIDTLKQLTDKYRTQKRGLIQKLLTEEWRIK